MAANRADADALPGRYFLVFVTGRVEADDSPAHLRQLADGLPERVEIIAGLDLPVHRIVDGLTFAGTGAEGLPFTVRVPQDPEGLVDHDPGQVGTLLARRPHDGDARPGR